MAIQIEKAKQTPPLSYNRIFLQRLMIDQTQVESDSALPIYKLLIEYKTYAVDENGNRHYALKSNTISMNDFVSKAIEKAQQGDMDLLNAQKAIEAALAKVLDDQTDLEGVSVI